MAEVEASHEGAFANTLNRSGEGDGGETVATIVGAIPDRSDGETLNSLGNDQVAGGFDATHISHTIGFSARVAVGDLNGVTIPIKSIVECGSVCVDPRLGEKWEAHQKCEGKEYYFFHRWWI